MKIGNTRRFSETPFLVWKESPKILNASRVPLVLTNRKSKFLTILVPNSHIKSSNVRPFLKLQVTRLSKRIRGPTIPELWLVANSSRILRSLFAITKLATTSKPSSQCSACGSSESEETCKSTCGSTPESGPTSAVYAQRGSRPSETGTTTREDTTRRSRTSARSTDALWDTTGSTSFSSISRPSTGTSSWLSRRSTPSDRSSPTGSTRPPRSSSASFLELQRSLTRMLTMSRSLALDLRETEPIFMRSIYYNRSL